MDTKGPSSFQADPNKYKGVQEKEEKGLKIIFESGKDHGSSPEVELIVTTLEKLTGEDRRALEYTLISQLMEFDSDIRYLIDSEWIQKYVSYMTSETEELPGPIVNSSLNKEIIKGDTIIFTVNKYLWNYFSLIYGAMRAISYNKNNPAGKENLEKWMLVDMRPSTKAYLASPPWKITEILSQAPTKRQEMELKFLNEHKSLDTELKFALDADWYKNYIKYLTSPTIKVPDVLYNEHIREQALREDWSGVEWVNEYIWEFFVKLYNASPDVAIKKINFDTKNSTVVKHFETWSEEISIRRERTNLPELNIDPEKLSTDLRKLLGFKIEEVHEPTKLIIPIPSNTPRSSDLVPSLTRLGSQTNINKTTSLGSISTKNNIKKSAMTPKTKFSDYVKNELSPTTLNSKNSPTKKSNTVHIPGLERDKKATGGVTPGILKKSPPKEHFTFGNLAALNHRKVSIESPNHL